MNLETNDKMIIAAGVFGLAAIPLGFKLGGLILPQAEESFGAILWLIALFLIVGFTLRAGIMLGVVLYGLVLCKTGKANEVNKWSRSVEYKSWLGYKAIKYLKGYSDKCK